jgi:L-ascorbate metabolism protein UlaG (beta-lactamase superfamily)
MTNASANPVAIDCLGQSGFRFHFGDIELLVDPYLSDRVAELYGEDLRRQKPAPLAPAAITAAEWVLITHAHEDHCDPATLVPLAAASPRARFLAPGEVIELLRGLGIGAERLVVAEERWLELGAATAVHPVPAAHPTLERDGVGWPRCVGYVLRHDGQCFYHAGDTSPHPEIVEKVRALGAVDVAFLPVNERNYYRERRGIVGNMSVREAFGLAEELGARTLVPIHWDLFAPNSVLREEIELLYARLKPPFRLLLEPSEI